MDKLHLGCGNKILPGFTNIDIQALDGVDLVADATSLPYPDDSVELIYACHLLEHFSRHKTIDVLKEWYRVLRPGGVLRVSVPNFAACAGLYLLKEVELPQIMGLLMGGQKNEFDYHKVVFDEKTLSAALATAGFRISIRYDWRDRPEHVKMDDYSQAYLPHMDKENGQLVSLNMEALK